jgi:SMI1 / KNR4 family protein
MKDIVNKIASLLNNNHGVDSKDITVIEEQLNAAFPQDYITLLKRSNGGEGYVGENYISLWKVEDLPALNEEYQIQKYLSEKFLGIGTDGGGICYGFCLDKNYLIFKCPLGDLDINEVVIIAKSTKDFFKKAMMEKL